MTTVVSGCSVKCNAVFAVLIFAVVLFLVCSLCSPVWILHICNIWEHQAEVRIKNTHNIVLSALSFDNVHLAGVGSLNLPFLLANGFKLYQIAG